MKIQLQENISDIIIIKLSKNIHAKYITSNIIRDTSISRLHLYEIKHSIILILQSDKYTELRNSDRTSLTWWCESRCDRYQSPSAIFPGPQGGRCLADGAGGGWRRHRRRMLASLGSLSPRQSYPGYAVPRDLPRLPFRQSSLPSLHLPQQQQRPSPMAAAVCLPACLSRTPRRTTAATRIEISRGPDITRRALLYSRRID